MPTDESITSEVRYVEIKPGYRVGDDGTAWSCRYPDGFGVRFGPWRRLKGTTQKSGHILIIFGKSKSPRRYLHSLVLEAFVGPCPTGELCRHLDGNPANNRLDNLAWGTNKENFADRIRHGKGGLQHPSKLGLPEQELIRTVVNGCTDSEAIKAFARYFRVGPALIRYAAQFQATV